MTINPGDSVVFVIDSVVVGPEDGDHRHRHIRDFSILKWIINEARGLLYHSVVPKNGQN